MSQFQTLIRSRDNTLNIQTLLLVKFLVCYYANAGVDKWLGKKRTLHKQGTKNSSVENVRCVFEDNIFVESFNTSCWSYQPIPWNLTIKFGGRRMRQRVEKNKKPSGSMYFIMIQYLLSEAVFIKKESKITKLSFKFKTRSRQRGREHRKRRNTKN